MDFKQLEYFKVITDAGSISEGARRLHMSQPPLSLQMKALEEELGVTLFRRDNRHLSLTDAGRILYTHAENMLDLRDSAVNETINAGRIQTLRVGITSTTLPLMLPILHELQRTSKHIRFEIYDANTFTLNDLLSRRIIEIAILRTPVSLVGMESIVIREESMFLASAEELPEQVSLQEVVKYPLVIYRRYHDLIMSVFSAHHLSPDILCTCDDARTALEFVRGGDGTAVFPDSMRSSCAFLHTSPIISDELKTKILLVDPSRQKAPLTEELIEAIQSRYELRGS